MELARRPLEAADQRVVLVHEAAVARGVAHRAARLGEVRREVVAERVAHDRARTVHEHAVGGVVARDVVGDEPALPSVRLIRESREIEITYGEFQRLKTIGAVKRP